jgi:UDP-glucose 4-epimerase
MQNIIVTGGAGYIGSHACKALKAAGYTPITIDNLITGWRDAVKFGPFEQVDLCDRDQLDPIFEKYKPAAVMHFAALSQVGESMKEPEKYWRNNVLGSLNLIEACVKHDVKNFVFSSTCATYGDQDNVVLDENSIQLPINSYGASKKAVEEILWNMEQAYGLKSVVFRYFNVAGADPDGEIGEFHQPETHLVPLILQAIDGQRDALTIFGTDYETPDGTCIRDYVHVCDLVDAHILGLRHLEGGGASSVFNLGTGSGFSVRAMIKEAGAITNRPVPVVEGERRPGDCTKLVSGSQKAKDVLGWNPQRSTPKEMITDAWRWHNSGNYTV